MDKKHNNLIPLIEDIRQQGTISYMGIAREIMFRVPEYRGYSIDHLRKVIKALIFNHENLQSNFEKHLKDQKTDPDSVNGYWDKTSKDYSVYVKNKENFFENVEASFLSVIDEIQFRPPYVPSKSKVEKVNKDRSIKAIVTDSHLGMDPNPRNKSLFQYEYNADIYKANIDIMFADILKEKQLFGKFDKVFLEDLGDRADGWNGYTTRGGHELPQNMSDEDVFRVAVTTQVDLIQKIVAHDVADQVVIRSVGNDNHAGAFGRIINDAIRMIIEKMYDKDIVLVDNLTKFIQPYYYGDHAFLLTHGKDDKVMKRGLPLHLDPKTINFINDYIKHYEINAPYIHVQKGDLHQVGYARCQGFDYRNFMSFAPPSKWVQGNFGDCYSGYSLQIIEKSTQEIKHIDKFFNMKKRFKNK
jgi:hypothetical protein